MRDWAIFLLHRISRGKLEWVPSSLRIEPPDGNSQVELLPLTAKYEPEHHEDYFNAIEIALTGKDRQVIKNIALTGSYGVGKSSILGQVARTHHEKVIQISLSTLGVPDDDQVSHAGANSKTNRIQKEIVKQLLYREDPDATPGSRFRRIGQLSRRRGLGIAALAALVLTVLFYLAGWSAQLTELVVPYWNPKLWAHLIFFAAFTFFVFALEVLIHNRLRVHSFSAGYATVSLSGDKEMTYFDQYLDEIVYFFEVTKADTVIFEDIDRFDDTHIFETLRALNLLVNGAQQLEGRSVRFIYAIKDSIFDELGRVASGYGQGNRSSTQDAAVVELARANRTKFFDLVIPVVPFITHRSARDLMLRKMNEIEHEVSPELIDLAAKHVADMRLIKNIRNEFVVFRQHVLYKDESIPGLTEDHLFAMMLYKNTHLSDFEAIKNRQSNLDRLYADYRKLVSDNIAHLDLEMIDTRRRIAKLDAIVTRSEALGVDFLSYIDRIARHLGVPDDFTRSITHGGRPQSDNDLKSADFWQAFIESDIEVEVNFNNRRQSQADRGFNISRADASEELDDPLAVDEWQEDDRKHHEARLEQLAKDRSFLRSADMSDLVEAEEFKIELGSGERRTFGEQVQQRLDSDLARQLLKAGYITKDFTLYSSTYYAERVSAQATTFLIQHVDPALPDAYFPLAPNDTKAILRERGEAVLRERGLYNISVLDYFLEAQDERADILILQLMTNGVQERSFLQSYFTGGKHREALIRKFASRWPYVFTFLVSQAKIDEDLRLQLLNTALENLDDEATYELDDRTRAYIEDNYKVIPIFTSDMTSEKDAQLVAKLLVGMNARIPSLSALGEEVKRQAIATNRYRITGDNLKSAVGGAGQDLALDRIQNHDPAIYEYMIQNLAAYLTALEETRDEATTVATFESFGGIIEEVIEHADTLLPRVVAAASPECHITQLVDVSEAAWPELVKQQRIPASLGNVSAYIHSIGEIDAALAQLLQTAGSITPSDDMAAADKEAIALHILAARKLLPDPALRIDLVMSFEVATPLPATSIQPESGRLIGLLIEKGVVADDAASFVLAPTDNWPTREFAISKSKQFISFMSPTEISIDAVTPLMSSACIADDVKNEILRRVSEFVPTDDRNALSAIASYATKHQQVLSVEIATRMAGARVDAQLLVRVLEPLLPSVTETELVEILGAMGGTYAELSERNGKHPKLPDTRANLSLLVKLEELGIVNSHAPSVGGVVAHMKRA